MIFNILPMFERSSEDVIVLDGNIDIYSNPTELTNWIERISKFIE